MLAESELYMHAILQAVELCPQQVREAFASAGRIAIPSRD